RRRAGRRRRNFGQSGDPAGWIQPNHHVFRHSRLDGINIMFIKIISAILISISTFSASVATAQEKPMRVESAVQLLKPADENGGEPALLVAKNVVPGDTLVFTTSFRNQGSAAINDFVIVNPVPADVVLADEPAADAQVSVDGAKTWGQLAEL